MAALLLAGIGGGAWYALRGRPAPAPTVTIDPVDATEARLRQAAAEAPHDPRPCRDLAEHFARQRRFVSAIWEFQTALDRSPSDTWSRIGLGKAAANIGEFGLAAAQFEAVLKPEGGASETQRREAARALSVVKIRTGRAAEAAALLGSLKQEFPDLHLDRARAHRAAGQFPAAEAEYRRAIGDPTSRRDASLGLAQLYLEQSEALKAATVLSQAGREGPMDAELWLWLGRAYARLPGGLDRAAGAVLNGMKLAPKNADLYYEAGLLFARKGEKTAAADQLAQAVRLDPNHLDARRALAETLDGLGLSGRAREHWVLYYERTNQPDRLIAALTGGDGSATENAETAYRVVYAWSQLQDARRAAEVAEKARRKHPESRPLLAQAISVQLTAGSRARFDALATEWEKRFPEYGEGPWLRGRAALSDARIADAVKLFEEAVAREPKHPTYRLALADAYTRIPTPENLQKALPLVEAVAAEDPRASAARRQIGDLLLRLGRPKEAIPYLLRSLDLDSDQRAGRSTLLQACGTLGLTSHATLLGQVARDAEAREREFASRRRAIEARPDDPAAHEAYGRSLLRAGLLQAAWPPLARAAEEPARASARQALADLERTRLVLGL